MSGDVQELKCLRTKQARFISTDRAFLFKMADGKKSFLLYADQRGIFEKLPDEEAGKLIKHIYSYVNDEDPKGDFIVELAFESIKTQLKRDLKKWEKQQEQRREAGRNSAEKRKQAKKALDERERDSTLVDDNSISSTVNDNVNVTVNVNDNVTVNETDNNNSSASDDASADYEVIIWPSFDDFWDLYDKKINRGKCEKKWNKQKQEVREEIMMHVEEYVKATPDEQYRKNPETYLNNSSWKDQIIQKTNKNGKFTQSTHSRLTDEQLEALARNRNI